jgi:hypothetical protein
VTTSAAAATLAATIWATENPHATNQRDAKRLKPSETETRRTGHHDGRN